MSYVKTIGAFSLNERDLKSFAAQVAAGAGQAQQMASKATGGQTQKPAASTAAQSVPGSQYMPAFVAETMATEWIPGVPNLAVIGGGLLVAGLVAKKMGAF